MKQWEIIAEYISEDIITVEAETEEEAMQKFDEGDFTTEHSRDYRLHEFISIKDNT